MVRKFRFRGRRAVEIKDRLYLVGPLPEDTGQVGGVGLYHLRLIEALAALAPAECELLVYSQKSSRSQRTPVSSNVRVLDTWRSGLPAIMDLWKLAFARPGAFIIKYEVQLFGSVIASLLLPPLITCIRIRGSRVFVLMHHVIGPALTTETLKDWKTPSLIDGVALAVLRANQWLIALAASAVIVHERSQATMLRAKRTFIVPHGVSVRSTQQQTAAFPERTLRVAIFGFIAPYKGSLEAAQAASKLLNDGVRIELNIVGGEHPRMRTSADYQSYIAQLRGLTELHPELTMKGFVPASELDRVLLENDLVVLPYKAAIGVSGAFSYAIGLGLPVAVSNVLGELMDLPMDIPRFDPSAAGITTFLRHTINERQLPAGAPIYSLATSRSWTTVGRRVWDLIRSPSL